MALSYKLHITQEIFKKLPQKSKLDYNHVLSNIRFNFDSIANNVSFTYRLNPDEPVKWNDLSPKNEFIRSVQFCENKIQFSVDIENYLLFSLNDCLRFNATQSLKKGSKNVIDFSSPNIAKPFHFGHLRSTMIGNYISNISEHMGDKVIRINYLGDWGVQFGLLKYGLDECGINIDKLNENPLRVLYEAYVAANSIAEQQPEVGEQAKEIFRKMEFADQENDDLKKWASIRSQTVDEISKVYERLGIRFDEYNWESDYSAKRIEGLIKTLVDRNIVVKENDAWVAKLYCNESVPFVKSDGTTLYLTRDLAAVLDRYQRYNFDKMLYVVDNSQSKHFRNLTRLVEKLDSQCAEKIQHVMFGRVIGISSRKGTAVFLDDILNSIREKMEENRKNTITTKGRNDDEIADILGISAVVVNDLKRKRNTNYNFDWNSVFNSKGDTGIRLQYSHCRLYSLEENCGIKLPIECDLSVLKEPEAVKLIIEISRYEDVIVKSYNHLESGILLKYLFELCDAINRAHKVLRVKGESDHVASQRLLIFHKARLILNTGMKIIGIKPLNQM
ncbi:probable arginine--tRNA ligase, mitochondrial [Planococcus citri]|uniref:probable arginine--tRNA ligase, mitochondrial n=1 Tax=Planococcus citri TaxID=170843 RepID=UPI0031F84CDA